LSEIIYTLLAAGIITDSSIPFTFERTAACGYLRRYDSDLRLLPLFYGGL